MVALTNGVKMSMFVINFTIINHKSVAVVLVRDCLVSKKISQEMTDTILLNLMVES